MRKKALLQQNLSLYEQLQKSLMEINSLQEELQKSKDEINALKALAQQSQPEETKETAVPMRNLQEKLTSEHKLDADTEYGAKIIGDIVVSAAQCSNLLTSGGDTSHRELVNLILGKSKLAKSDILEIVSGCDSFENKKRRINIVCAEAKEYFESVIAQLI